MTNLPIKRTVLFPTPSKDVPSRRGVQECSNAAPRDRSPQAVFRESTTSGESTACAADQTNHDDRTQRRPLRNWPAPLRRIGGGTVLGIALLVVASGALASRKSTLEINRGQRDQSERAKPEQNVDGKARRIREGTVLENMTGTFKSTGGRITFYPADSTPPLHALENLALERVWRLQDVSQGRQWSVSGVVTEFRAANYLLITKAVLKNSK